MKKEKLKKYIKVTMVTAFVCIACVLTVGLIYSNHVFDDISDNVVRLHVIANSDSEYDQNLKLKVRDAVIWYSENSIGDCKTSDEVLCYLNDHCEEIKSVAEDCLRKEGNNYDVAVSVGTYEFPSKNYGKYCFPEGKYRALRVEIGESVGKNWWCVLFPPLCYVSENAVSVSNAAEIALKNNMSSEAFDTVFGEQNFCSNSSDTQIVKNSSGIDSGVKVSYKFKIVEFFRGVFSFFTD